MASLSNVLASIPGMAGYYAKAQLNREQTAGDLQQIGALSQLQAQMASRQRQEAARQALAGLGPDATEDQRVQALLPHIGDPDKIAGILQNASLKKAQQAQTREIAAQNLSQRLATEARHAYEFAKTLPLKERQVALQEINTRLNAAYKQGMLRLSAGEAQWSRGEDVSPIMDYLNTMRGIVDSPSAPQGASAAQVAPTPQPAPSAAPGPVSAPSGPAPMGRQGPMDGKAGQLRILDGELAQLDQMIQGARTPEERAQFEANRASVQRERDAAAAGIPAAPNNLDARDLRLAAGSAPTAAPQAAPQPAPASAPQPAPIVMPPEIARLPKKAQDAWMADEIKRREERGRKGELPTQALKLQNEELDGISTAASIRADLGAITSQLIGGKLKLGLIENVSGDLRNKVGISDEDSRNLNTFKATLERLRNDSLRLNKGVQTEGDAVRAWNELISGINDPGVVKQRLDEIQRINTRAINIRKLNVENIRRNYSASPFDFSPYENQPAAVGPTSPSGAGTVREFNTEAEAAAAGLAPGTRVKIGGKTGTWK
jgi:hypothetical protein